ncbi:methionyl-tRNA formyltransferase [Salisediminibacterium selenitireducens]|uniref:Methionyl-tRNA formyltransferase n=1 Tax=Bacillus selenitireducens (strain ATCC 700615 / DSM 15326 / MLS10) TaxID=439292 RepID=D6XTR4_BACIE|nr:methionyl-tRNA formyltransferase [Salisediminibacterium selenitireducens]ADH99200.1 methionyl-tRNA formyltransferase [[Bacillus] selenitireducens MLS10]
MKVIFMGTPDFSVPVLEGLCESGYDVVMVVTQPDRPKGRKKQLTPPPVKVAAEKRGLSVYQPEKIRDPKEAEHVLAADADLLVTAAYGQILPKEILESTRLGCINVHASLLPEYRGGAPIHQAVIDGKNKTGITIMYMVEKLDAGDILTQRETPITDEDTTGTMHDRLSRIGAELLLETIPRLAAGELSPRRQDEEKVTFASNIKKEQERVDFSQSARAVFNHIRGLNPWPVAHTLLDGKRLKLWDSVEVEEHTAAAPGEIVALSKSGVDVACGNRSIIRLTKLQPQGKKPMDAATFLQGAGKNLEPGHRLGDDDDS